MGRNEFVKKMAEKAGISSRAAADALAAFEETMLEDVFAAEDSVRLSIGTFSGYTKETAARVGRNPATGETIKIPAKKIKGYPKFRPSKVAKQ